MKLINRIFNMVLLILVGLTFSLNAQTSNKQIKMKSSSHLKKEAALDGYCPVAYHVLKKAVKGKPDLSSKYDGKTYHFVNAKAKKMFDKDPGKFLPKYGGYCATAMSMGKKLESNPKLFTEYKGETYLFSSKKAKEMFDKNPSMFVKKANEEYSKLKK